MESEFIKYIERGIFKIPICTECEKRTWPPSSICPVCYSDTTLQDIDGKGTIMEITTSHINGHDGTFGIVEMDGFRLVGSFEGTELAKGMRVRMVDCGIRNGTIYYLFVPEK